MLFTEHAFGTDWPNHLWLVWIQGLAISDAHQPTVFLSADPIGVFQPFYGMYGGTLYAIGGGLSSIFGTRPVVAYIVLWGIAVGMAYGGILWLALLSGLRGIRAHAPAIVYVTASYFVTDIYVRGVLPEVMATSALIVFIAATVHLIRAPRIGLLPAGAFVGALVLLTGSHNISLVWGAVVALALAVSALVALPRHGRELPARRIAVLAGIAVLAVGINAWFLLPDLAYSSKTLVGGSSFDAGVQEHFGRLSVLFSPKHVDPKGFPDYFTQLPVFVLLWLVVTLPFVWRREGEAPWRRLTLCVAGILAVLIGLMLFQKPWDCCVPNFLTYIQFSYRLETYALLCIAILLIAALRVAPEKLPSRLFGPALAAAIVYGAVLAVSAMWSAPQSYPDRAQVFQHGRYAVPDSWFDHGSYRDASARVVKTAPGRTLHLDPSAVQKDRLDADVAMPAGGRPVLTNIATGTYFVDLKGVKPVGRTGGALKSDKAGFMVITPKPGGHIEVTRASSLPIVAGRWISLISLLGLAALATLRLVSRARRRA
jgi:hypothetical protein